MMGLVGAGAVVGGTVPVVDPGAVVRGTAPAAEGSGAAVIGTASAAEGSAPRVGSRSVMLKDWRELEVLGT